MQYTQDKNDNIREGGREVITGEFRAFLNFSGVDTGAVKRAESSTGAERLHRSPSPQRWVWCAVLLK